MTTDGFIYSPLTVKTAAELALWQKTIKKISDTH